MNVKYSWTKQYSVSPQVAGEIIKNLPDRTAESLLKEARKKSCPLRSQFEWDDSLAAHQHRLIQARTMLNSLRVVVVAENRKPQAVMAFIQKADKSSRYVPIMEADSDDLTALEIKCLDHMRAFKQRWKGLQFARDVIAEISAVEVDAARRKKRRKAK